MAKAVQKIILSASRDIPFNKLVLSQSNVRRRKAGVSIEDLAEDIARRGLLQSLNVRPVLDADGAETGQFEIPAGGRRYRALERLVRQKRLSKTALIPCIVRDPGVEVSAEEDSLAENVQRVARCRASTIADRKILYISTMTLPSVERRSRTRSPFVAPPLAYRSPLRTEPSCRTRVPTT
jgi:ParB-like chromosome segregation protein Spo0J